MQVEPSDHQWLHGKSMFAQCVALGHGAVAVDDECWLVNRKKMWESAVVDSHTSQNVLPDRRVGGGRPRRTVEKVVFEQSKSFLINMLRFMIFFLLKNYAALGSKPPRGRLHSRH